MATMEQPPVQQTRAFLLPWPCRNLPTLLQYLWQMQTNQSGLKLLARLPAVLVQQLSIRQARFDLPRKLLLLAAFPAQGLRLRDSLRSCSSNQLKLLRIFLWKLKHHERDHCHGNHRGGRAKNRGKQPSPARNWGGRKHGLRLRLGHQCLAQHHNFTAGFTHGKVRNHGFALRRGQ